MLGIGGLVGAQRTELVESIFGLRALKSGTLIIDGKEVHIGDSTNAMDNRLALLTEDRKGTGLFPVLSVGENINVASYKRLSKVLGIYRLSRLCEACAGKR